MEQGEIGSRVRAASKNTRLIRSHLSSRQPDRAVRKLTRVTSDCLYVDAHAHYHSVFQPRRYLAAACENFQRYFHSQRDDSWIGVLLLADTQSQNTIEQLATASIVDWALEPTEDECAWLARQDGRVRLVLVAGRQIATAERLEVMALATSNCFEDGQSVHDTLRQVCSAGAIPVVPWGFGKWSFQRGAIVAQLMQSLSSGDLGFEREVFLGDNGGRARVLGAPRLFNLATNLGLRILPGSDPLPLARHIDTVGSYGFSLPYSCDEARPATQLKTLLGRNRSQPRTYGHLQPTGVFVRNQVAMQLRKIGASATAHPSSNRPI
jgi:hypothetical protein